MTKLISSQPPSVYSSLVQLQTGAALSSAGGMCDFNQSSPRRPLAQSSTFLSFFFTPNAESDALSACVIFCLPSALLSFVLPWGKRIVCSAVHTFAFSPQGHHLSLFNVSTSPFFPSFARSSARHFTGVDSANVIVIAHQSRSVSAFFF